MSKTTEIKLNNNKIVVSHKSLIKNQVVHLEFLPINKYQLSCNKITIENKSKITNINSTDFRKINIHNLVKTSIRLIDKNIELDISTYSKNSPIYNPKIDSKDLITRINNKKYNRRSELLSMYSLLYINTEREYGENISSKISDKIKYKESYVKNLTKECFTKGYLKSSKKGLAGGTLSKKSLKILTFL
tara:strand:- start:98 stop:664 length:567 start_codon:yes stop_codon:yes gene_type:complete